MKCFPSPFPRNHKVMQLECNWPKVRVLQTDLNYVIKTPQAENAQQNDGWKILQALIRGTRFSGTLLCNYPKQEVILCMSNMKIMISEEVEKCLHRRKQEIGRARNIRYI